MSAAEYPSVTAVVPSTGRPELLAAVRSIVAQDYRGEIECVVVDDTGEVDERACERLRQTRRSVRVMRNERTPGPCGARNTGVAHGAGEYVAFLDDDDTWRPQKITKQVRALLHEDRPALVVTGFQMHSATAETDRIPPAGGISHEQVLRNRRSDLHLSTFLLRRRDYVERIGMLDENVPGGYAEDYDYLLRASSVGCVLTLAEPLADINGITSVFAGRWALQIASQEYLLEKHPDLRRNRRAYARLRASMAIRSAGIGDRRQGRRYAREAVRSWPLHRWAYIALATNYGVIDPARVLRFRRGLTTDPRHGA